MQRLRFRFVALWCVLIVVGGMPAGAEEKQDELVTRLFDVSALTMGRPDFIGEQLLSPGDVGDEDSPLFGAEGEEPIHPAGLVGDLMFLLQSSVEPASWGSVYGAAMSEIGERTIRVRTFPDIADKVAAFLGALQRLQMRTVAIDLRAVRLSADEAAALLEKSSATLVDEAKLARIVTAENSGPGTSMLGYERHRFTMYSGTQRAYVWDYDVEVAEEAKISDPLVAVENLGLSATVRTILSADMKSCLVTLNAFLADPVDLRQIANGEDGRVIEASEQDVARLLTKLDLPANRWALIDGQHAAGDGPKWMFLVRARPIALRGLAQNARGITLESPASRPSRTMIKRSFNVASLAHAVGSTLGESINLTPSNFTPPEPPELPDATPVFPVDAIVELMQGTVAPATWDLEGAGIMNRFNRLYMRNAPYVLDAVEKNLTTLRKEFLTAGVTRAELISMPEATAMQLGLEAGAVVSAANLAQVRQTLEAGDAQRQGGARVTTMAGARNTASSGRRISYLSDFEVEIAKGAAISNPVMQNVVSGAVLDVQTARTVGGQSMQTVLRFTRSLVKRPLRKVTTPHGELEAPEMDLFRVRSVVRIPLGQTMVAATASKGGVRQVLLVTSEHAPSAR